MEKGIVPVSPAGTRGSRPRIWESGTTYTTGSGPGASLARSLRASAFQFGQCHGAWPPRTSLPQAIVRPCRQSTAGPGRSRVRVSVRAGQPGPAAGADLSGRGLRCGGRRPGAVTVGPGTIVAGTGRLSPCNLKSHSNPANVSRVSGLSPGPGPGSGRARARSRG